MNEADILQNKNLSLSAKGLYFYLKFVCPDGGRIDIDELINSSSSGFVITTKAIDELVENNIIIKKNIIETIKKPSS
jgi:hypothetical protein